MESFAWYLLKSATWLSGFTLVYLMFLQNERFFRLKRYYLVAGILVSFIFPLITFHYIAELPAGTEVAGFQNLAGQDSGAFHRSGIGFSVRNLLIAVYFAGIIILLFKSLRQIGNLLKSIRGKKITNISDAKIVRSSEYSGSFSFFNYILINPSVSGSEMDAIMNHELVHIRQMHWIDLLLADIIRLIQWANPFAWIYIRFIRQNHEYLADEVALETSADPALYKAVLVNQLLGARVIDLSSYFSNSLNKRRFEMMKKAFWSPYRTAKLLLIAPVIIFIFYAFATPEYVPAGDGVSMSEAVPAFASSEYVPAGDGVSISEAIPSAETVSDGNLVGYQVLPRPEFVKKTNVVIKNSEKSRPVQITRITAPEKLAFVSPPAAKPPEPFVVVQQMPHYPGGEYELLRFLSENTKYPEEALTKGIEGKVIVRFVVNTEGNTEGISILKGIHPLLDAEAERVVSILSGFEPGVQNGEAVPVWYMVPINFVMPSRSL